MRCESVNFDKVTAHNAATCWLCTITTLRLSTIEYPNVAVTTFTHTILNMLGLKVCSAENERGAYLLMVVDIRLAFLALSPDLLGGLGSGGFTYFVQMTDTRQGRRSSP
jgi:hypothetical protein